MTTLTRTILKRWSFIIVVIMILSALSIAIYPHRVSWWVDMLVGMGLGVIASEICRAVMGPPPDYWRKKS
jgi:hypothetical protein